MSKYLYKQYVRLVTRWPKDQYKSPERDLAVFLSREVERQFKSEPSALDAALCERRYRALEQISENYTANLYPHQYKSGVFGLNLQQLQAYLEAGLKFSPSICSLFAAETSTEENRRQFGLGREGILKKVWKAIFPPKPSKDASV